MSESGGGGPIPGDELRLDITLAEFGAAIEAFCRFQRCDARGKAGADRDPAARDRPHLDERLSPIGDEQLLARIGALERRTGQRLIFPAR